MAIRIDENVVWFQITVNIVQFVQRMYGHGNLGNVETRLFFAETVFATENRKKVT